MYSRFSAVVRFSEPPLGTRFRALVGQPCAPTPQSWLRIPGVDRQPGRLRPRRRFILLNDDSRRSVFTNTVAGPGFLACRPRGVSVAEGCRLMGIGRSVFYDTPEARARDLTIVAEMKTICDEFEAYGYRRVERIRRSSHLPTRTSPRPLCSATATRSAARRPNMTSGTPEAGAGISF
jgi:hypothetical protein